MKNGDGSHPTWGLCYPKNGALSARPPVQMQGDDRQATRQLTLHALSLGSGLMADLFLFMGPQGY